MSAAVSAMTGGALFLTIWRCTMEMSPELMFMVGLVASVIVWVVRAISKRGGSIPSGWLTAGVYVVAGLLAWAFSPVSLPPFPTWGGDLAGFVPALVAWAGELLVPLSAFVGFATLVYNALLKRVLDGIAERFGW
jgi:hypothetical protein